MTGGFQARAATSSRTRRSGPPVVKPAIRRARKSPGPLPGLGGSPARKLHFEALEPRVLLNADPWSVALNAAGAYTLDVIDRVVNETTVKYFQIVDSAANQVDESKVSETKSIEVIGSSGNDVLTIDFDAIFGLPSNIFELSTISFIGNAGNDSLIFSGGNFTSLTNTADNNDASKGGVTLDPVGTAHDLLSDVTYQGLHSLVLGSTIGTLTHNATSGNDAITVENAAASGRSQITGGTFVDLVFDNPTAELVIAAGAGNDDITLKALDSGFAPADLRLTFGNNWGKDTLIFNGFGGPVILDFTGHAEVVSAELKNTGTQGEQTLTIISGADFADAANSLTIANVNISQLALLGAEFEPDISGASDPIANAIQALRAQVQSLTDQLAGVAALGPLGAALPLLQQFDDATGEVFSAQLGEALLLIEMLEKLKERVAGFAEAVDDFTEPSPALTSFLNGGPLSLQLAKYLADWSAAIVQPQPEPEDEPFAVYGALMASIGAVRLVPNRSNGAVDELKVELDLSATNTTNFDFDIGAEASFLGIQVHGALPAVQLGGRIDAMLPFVIANLNTPPSLSLGDDLSVEVAVDLTASGITAGIGFGFLDASFDNASINATFSAEIVKSEGTLAVNPGAKSLSADLPFRIELDLFKNASGFAGGFGLAGALAGNALEGVLTLSSSDVFAGDPPEVSFDAGGFDDLLQRFDLTSPGDVFGMLEQLRNVLEQISVSDLLTAEIPFLGKRLGEVLPFAESFDDALLGNIFAIIDGDRSLLYTGAQSLAQQIKTEAAAFGLDIEIDFSLDPLPQLLFDVEWTQSFNTQDIFGIPGIPIGFNFELGDLGNISISGSPTIALDVDFAFNFTFGIELAAGAPINLGFPLFVPEPDSDLLVKGHLSDAATFSFNLFDRQKTGTENGKPTFVLHKLTNTPFDITLSATTDNIAPGPVLLRSAATGDGGANNRIADTTANFTKLLSGVGTSAVDFTDAHVFVVITSGTGAGQMRAIDSIVNDNTVQVKSNWGTNPDSSSRYEIVSGLRALRGDVTGGTTSTLSDANADFTGRLNPNGVYFVEIVDGNGRGDVRKIESFTKTTLTVAPNFSAAPGASSGIDGRYQIYLGDPTKTLVHDLQRAINDQLHAKRGEVAANTNVDSQLRPGDVVVDWTGTRFTLEAPATRVVTQDPVTLIETTKIVDRVLSMADFNAVAKDQLGLVSSPLRFDGRFTDPSDSSKTLDAEFIVNVEGTDYTVTLLGSETSGNTSIDTLIGQLNTALATAGVDTDKVEFFRKSLNGFADGNVIGLRGTDVTSLEMRLPDGADSDPTTSDNAAVVHLGLTDAVNGRSLATEFFIRGADDGDGGFESPGFSADVKLTIDELVFGASLGFLGVEVELNEPGTITAGFGLGLVDPATGDGRVNVDDLWREMSARRFMYGDYDTIAQDDGTEKYKFLGAPADSGDLVGGFVKPTLDFAGHFDFTARATGLPQQMVDAIENFLGDNALAVDFDIQFDLRAEKPDATDLEFGKFVHSFELGNVSALQLGYFVVEAELDSTLFDTIEKLEDLLNSFRNLSFSQIVELLNTAVNFVADLDGALGTAAQELLDFELPLVGQSIGGLLDFTEDFARTLDEVMADPAASVQEVENRLREALGLSARNPDGSLPDGSGPAGFDLVMGFDPGDNDIDPALRFDISFGFGFNETLPIDLDIVELLRLAGITIPQGSNFSLTELLGLAGSGGLTLSGGGGITLALGLPMVNPLGQNVQLPEDALPFFYIGEEGTRLDFDINLSGNDLAFEARVLTLGVYVRGGEGSLTADFGLFLDDEEHGSERLLLSQLGSVGGLLKPSFGGSAELTLPLFFPTENRHLFDLGVEVPSLAKLVNHLSGADLELEADADENDPLVIITPNDILDRFTFQPPSLLDLLLDPSLVINGLESGLDFLEDALRGQILGIDLPLIGDALAPAADFIENFRGEFLTPLASEILAGLSQYESTAHGLQDILYRVFGTGTDKISAFGKQFGALGLLTGSSRDDIKVSGAYANNNGVLEFDGDATFIQFEWTLGSSLLDIDLPTGFDIGIPGLGLELNADISFEIAWELNFGFGIDATTGFYIVTYDSDDDTDTLTLDATATLKGTGGGSTIEGTLGFLKLVANDHVDEPTNLTAGFTLNLKDPKKDEDKNDRIAFKDLVSRGTKLSDILSAELTGSAHVGLAATVDFSGLGDLGIDLPVSSLPAVDFDFIMDWDFPTVTLLNGKVVLGDGPQVHINDITLHLGSFISEFAGPILDIFGEILGPLEWLIGPDGLLNKRIPILSDLAGTTITLKTLAETFDQNARITPFLELAEQIFGLIKMVDTARAEAESANGGAGLTLNFGSIHLNELFDGGDLLGISDLSGYDPTKLVADSKDALENLAKDVNFDGASSSKQFTNTLTKGSASFKFPILEPATVFKLLMGDVVDLVQIDLPELAFGFEYRQVFHVFGPLAATLRGAFSATLDLALGYDTLGIANFQSTNNALDLIDGFYFSTVDFDTGERKPALTLRGEIAAGAALSMGVATAGVEGGIAATIYFDWNDPNQDTKVRLKEMVGNIEANFPSLGPLAVMSVFDITGVIEWFFKAFVEVNLLFFKFSKSWDLGGGVIAEFEIPFERQGVLASKDGDTLILNIGPNAHSRIQGDIRDIGETIFAASDNFNAGNGTASIDVWAPQFNVSAGNPQTFHGIKKIVAHGGAGNDVIDLSGILHPILVDIDGGAGNDIIKLGMGALVNGQTSTIRGGSGSDTIIVDGGPVIIDGGPGFDDITAASQGGLISAGSGGGTVTIIGGGNNELEHVIDAGTNTLDLSAAGANTTHRILFGDDIGADNTIFGATAAGTKTILDFSQVSSANIRFDLVEGTVSGSSSDYKILVTYGENNKAVIDGNVDLIIGGKGGDNFHVFATAGIDLDGGAGADQYFVYASDLTIPPPIEVRLRDTGTDAWNKDELFIIGTGGADDITVVETVSDYQVILGASQSVSFFNKAGFVDESGLVTQLTVQHDVGAIPEGELPAGIARLIIEGRDGNDVIKVQATPAQMGIYIDGGAGADTVVIGADVLNQWSTVSAATAGNLDGIKADSTQGGFVIVGGTGANTLIVDDSGNTIGKNEHGDDDNRGTLQRHPVALGYMQLAGLGMGTDLRFVEFDNVEVRLGQGNDRFDIIETIYLADAFLGDEVIKTLRVFGGDGDDRLNLFDSEPGTEVHVFGDYPVDLDADNFAGGGVGGNDIINIFATRGETTLYGGPGDDIFNVHSIDAATTIYGGRGDDTFRIGVKIDSVTSDAIPDTGVGGFLRNLGNLIGAELTLNGQDGGDNYVIWLGGEGSATINVFDTGDTGGDFLRMFGSEGNDLFLIRAGVSTDNDIGLDRTGQIGFVALFNEHRNSSRDDVERINYARDTVFNTGINGGVILDGAGGFGEFYVDDTLGPMTLLGATEGNYFQFGQLYNSPRAENEFSHILPSDEFQTMETTRGWLSHGVSFDLTAIGAENHSNEFVVLNNQATLNLFGGDANDRFVVRSFALVGSIDPKRENIDISTGGGENFIEYVIGAPVNIDGGGGFNTLVVIGTEFADDYVITEDGIFGAGRLVNFVNIQQLEVDGAEGNDRFFILGTAPGTSVVLSGGLGSDAFFVGGEAPDIISRDLKGHSGIISHGVSSADAAFNGIKVDDVSANVADNNEAAIVVTETGGSTIVVDGAVRDSYSVVLTRAPTGTVTVTASMSPRPVTIAGERQLRSFVQFSNEEDGTYHETVELTFNASNWFTPQNVWIQVKGDEPHTGIISGFVAHDVAGDQTVGTTTTAIRVVGKDPNTLTDTNADFGPDNSLRGAIVEITQGFGKGQSRLVIGNTATTLTLDKPWVLDPVAEADAGANLSDYQIRQFEGLAIPAVQVKAYYGDVGAAIIAPSRGLTVIEQATDNGVDFEAAAPFVASYQVVLTKDPGGAVTVDLVTIDDLVFADASGNPITSLNFTSANWHTPQTVQVAIAADGVVTKARTLEIGHEINGTPLESVFVRVIDGDSPSVVITESSGSTNVIEGGALDGDDVDSLDLGVIAALSGGPFVDHYTAVLSQKPTEDVHVVVRAEGTRTSKGNMVNFGEQVELAIKDGAKFISYRLAEAGEESDPDVIEVDGTLYKKTDGAGGVVVLVFTPDNWDTPQTVFVQALDDDVIDGGDTKVFATRSDDTSRIQGPLELRGGGGQGSLVGLPIALLFPHLPDSANETNEFVPTGAIQHSEDAGATSIVVTKAALEAFIIRYGLDFGLDAEASIFDALIGATLRMLDGENGNEFSEQFAPRLNDNPPPPFLEPLQAFDPFDLDHQLMIPFREIVGWNDAGLTVDLIRLMFPEDLSWLYPIAADDEFVIINASPANFFAREEEQVDLMFVRDTDAHTDEVGRLLFHTENPTDDQDNDLYNVPLQFRGQLVGLGMGGDRTIGIGDDSMRLPGGIVFDEIEMLEVSLGSGDNHFVIEGTHSGTTRLNTGAGNDTVEVWSVAGPTTVDGGLGDDVITVGRPDGDVHSLLGIAALLTIAGDVPEAFARTTVRGEVDVLAQDGSLLAQGSTNEQEIRLVNADGGTFTLRFKGAVEDPDVQSPVGHETAPIDFDATAADIKQKLLDLENENGALLQDGDFEVERFGELIIIRFSETGAFAKTPMQVFGVSSAELTSTSTSTLNVRGTGDVDDVWALLTQTTLTGLGMPVFNAIQTIYVDDPLPGDALRDFTLRFAGEETEDLNVGMSAAAVQAALEALETIGEGNVAVSKVDKVFVVRFQGELTNQVASLLQSSDDHVHIAVRETGIGPLGNPNIPPSADSKARNDLQTLTIEATGGSFKLQVGGVTTGAIAYNATAAELREALQRLLPDRFADDIAVARYGNVYHVLFQGLLRTVMNGPGTGFLKVDASELDGAAHLATRMDGLNYYGIDTFNLQFGPASENPGGHVLNVQGTSAAHTNINLNEGDDRIFVSSDADLDHNTLFPDGAAYGFDFLTGHLDLILGDLNIDADKGRHQLMVSDEATALAKGTDDDPVTIQRPSSGFAVAYDILDHLDIEMLNWAGGAIRYGAAEDANFFDGITLWGGAHGNVFDVDATHLRAEGHFSTLTTLNSGIGSDAVYVSLEEVTDGHFVLNAQEGDDWVDARGSTLPLVLIGHDGDDVIFGGDGGDIIFGDRGRIIHYYGAEKTTVIGHGGRFDFTDARLDLPNVIRSIIHEPDNIVLVGGRDVLVGGDGDDIVFGGSGSDVIDGGAGRDLIFGDNAELDRRETQGDFVNPRFRALTGKEIYDTGENRAGDLLIDRTDHFADPDWADEPPVWADLVITIHDGLSVPAGQDAAATQGDNYIAGGAGSDMIFGQRGEDTIQGDGSIFWDVWQGHGEPEREHLGGWVPIAGLDPNDPNRSDFDRHDFALLTRLTERPDEPMHLPRSFESADDGDDYIEAGAGNDVVFGNLGQNDIIGGSSNQFGLTEHWQRDSSGANIIFGGAGTRIDRNDLGYDEGDGGLVSFEDRHARNASVILGDNGNIFRLVELDADNGSVSLHFNYDRARYGDPTEDPPEDALLIKARGVDLLDYKRWELAQAAAGITVPGHLGFVAEIGEGDLIHGESGDDVIFGMGGDNVIFGHAGDDLIVGGFGNNWISGGTGDDGILGDDGLILISRNNPVWGEPLYGILPAVQKDIITSSGQFNERINVEGAIKHTARLFGFAYETGGNDIIYGGLGNDSIHAGAGDDAISGAEALPDYFSGELNWLMKLTQNPDNEEGLAPEAWFYQIAPYNPGNVLQASSVAGQWFRLYNPTDPLRLMLIDEQGNLATEAEFHYTGPLPDADDPFNFDLSQLIWHKPGAPDARLYDFFLNFDPTEGERDTRFPEDLQRVPEGIPSDGDDVIFGNLGNNWIVGGSGRDHIWGGWGDSVLNADDNHHTTLFGADPIANDREDPYQAYADIVFGGAGRDVLIGNTGADRLIDWLGEFNTYVVPFNPAGGHHIWRLAPSPGLLDFLLTLSKADGADQLLGLERGGDPDRQGEPMGEIALVTREDNAWSEQRGQPAKPFPKMYPGQRELMWRAFPGMISGPGGGSEPAAQTLSANDTGTQQTLAGDDGTVVNGQGNGNGGSKAGGKKDGTDGGGTSPGDDQGIALLFDADGGGFDEASEGQSQTVQIEPAYESDGGGADDWLIQGLAHDLPNAAYGSGDEDDGTDDSFLFLDDEDEDDELLLTAPAMGIRDEELVD
jgi:Ca2+-binding RTX toxin-like protein